MGKSTISMAMFNSYVSLPDKTSVVNNFNRLPILQLSRERQTELELLHLVGCLASTEKVFFFIEESMVKHGGIQPTW